MVLASLVMTVAMPTVTVAMARNQRSAQRSSSIERRMQRRANNKPATKLPKLSLWYRIKDNWEYIALGGCALAGIAAVLWNLHSKELGTKPNPIAPRPNNPSPRPNVVAPRPNPVAPRPVAVWIDEKARGECPICVAENVPLGHPSCCPNQICRACWDTPVKTGETEYVDENIGLRIVDESKVRKDQSCPFCRAGKK